ncbi:MAG: GumC domain-containing protein, partial [Candidatus Xenobia bacterium]
PVVLRELVKSQDFLEQRVIPNAHLTAPWTVLRDQIDLGPLADSGQASPLLLIGAEGSTPDASRVLADTVASQFMLYVPELLTKEFETRRKFLEGLVNEAKSNLDACEASVLNWQMKHQAMTAGDVSQEQMKTVSDLEAQRATAAEQLAAAQARLDMLKSYSPSSPPPLDAIEGSTTGRNSTVAQLQQNLAAERLKLSQDESIYKSGNATLVQQAEVVRKLRAALQQEIGAQVASMRAQRESDVKQLQDQVKSLDTSIQGLRSKWTLPADSLDFSKRQRDIENWNKNYEELLGELYQARIAEESAARHGAITLIERPQSGVAVVQTVTKSLQKKLTIGIAAGLALGILIAILLDNVTRSLRVTSNVEDVLGLPIIGTVPQLPRATIAAWQANKDRLRTPSTNGAPAEPAKVE